MATTTALMTVYITLWAMVLVPLPLEMRITLSVPLNCPPSKTTIRLTVLSTISQRLPNWSRPSRQAAQFLCLIWQMRSKKKSSRSWNSLKPSHHRKKKNQKKHPHSVRKWSDDYEQIYSRRKQFDVYLQHRLNDGFAVR